MSDAHELPRIPDPPPAAGPEDGGGVLHDHPEILVGAAFAGAFALAQVLKRVGR